MPKSKDTNFNRIDDLLVVFQALKMLRTPDLKPFIVYVKAPSFERLRDTRTTAYARSTFVENGNRAFTVRLSGLVTHRWQQLVTVTLKMVQFDAA